MTEAQSSFLKMAVPAAQASQRKFGVPSSITIAQAILESGWGRSALAVQARNYFGIKAVAHAAPDDYAEFPTTEFVDGRRTREMAKFARYATPAEGFAAHAELLARASRYSPAMTAREYPSAFAAQLQECGYSTNPRYARELMELVDEFDLTQYDLPPTPEAAAKREVA